MGACIDTYYFTHYCLPRIDPARLKTQITKIIRNEKLSSREAVSSNKPTRSRKVGKRLRLVQVDAKGVEIEENAPKRRRRRINQRSVLKCNVVSTTKQPQQSSDERNVCVLYTNFTSEGDYINDHDYLINPYIRNKMYYHHGSAPVCVCLLCDKVHQAKDHIDHMKSHRTICQMCRIDFHNVFILNLHVRCHSTYCSECKLTVTYANQIPHAQLHNRSLTLSNVDILEDIISNSLDTYGGKSSRQKKEKEPPPGLEPDKLLKDLLNEPVEDWNPRLRSSSTSTSSSNVSPRRSRRITRSRKLDLEESKLDGDEEACIYDKTTKSFITPTVEKQQKLLEKCSSNKVANEASKAAKDTRSITDRSSEHGEDEAIKNGKTPESNITSMLLCKEAIEDEPVLIDALDDDNERPVEAAKASAQPKIDSQKINKISKKRRVRRIFSVRSRKKVKKVSNLKESKSIESLKRETSKFGHSKGVSGTDVAEASKMEKEEPQSHNTKHPADDVSSSTEALEEQKSNTYGRTSKILRIPVRSRKDVKTYSKPNRKRKEDSRSSVVEHTSTVGSSAEAPKPLEATPDVTEETEIKLNDSIDISVERSEKDTSVTQAESVEPKAVRVESKKLVKLTKTESTDSTKSYKLNTAKCVRKNPVKPGGPGNSLVQINPPEGAADRVTTPKREYVKSAQNSEVKSPLRGDLKMRIKSIKYNPFVSMGNMSKPVFNVRAGALNAAPKTKPKALKTYDGASRKRKREIEKAELVDLTPSVQKQGDNAAANTEMQESESLDVTVDIKDKNEKKSSESIGRSVGEKEGESKKDLRRNPVNPNNSKARSSRSRGSLGLVEGLKGSERRYGYKIPRRSKKTVQDDSSTDLDDSHADLNETFSLKNVGVNIKEASMMDLGELPQLQNEDSHEATTVDLEPFPLKNVDPNEISTVVKENTEG